MLRKISGQDKRILDIHIDGRLYVAPNAVREYGDNVIPFPRKLTKESIESIPLSALPEILQFMAERGELYERL
jgi:hypothetical protein